MLRVWQVVTFFSVVGAFTLRHCLGVASQASLQLLTLQT